MRRSRSRGTAKSSRLQLKKTSGEEGVNLDSSEGISKYFLRKVPQSPYKSCSLTEIKTIENDDEGDFKSPVKLARIFTSPSSSKAKPKRKYTKKKSKENLVQKSLQDNFSSSGCNPEHLQLALALSKSEQTKQNDDSEDEDVIPVYPSTQEINEHNKTTLEKFRFKTTNPYYDPPKTNEVNKRRKRSRFQYVTPVLRTRTEQERQDLINAKISQILSDLPDSGEGLPTNDLQVDSESLQSLHCKSSRVFKSDRITNFYVSSLGFQRDEAWVCGKLLKNWDTIPGREISPIRKHSTELSMSPVKQAELSVSPVKQTELSPVKPTELSMSPVKQTELSMLSVKETELLMSPIKQTEQLMSSVKQTEQLTSAVKQTKLLMSSVNQTELSMSPVKQTELSTSSVKQTELSMSSVKQTELSMSPVKQTELSMSFVKQTELSMSPVKQTELLMSSVKQTEQLTSPVKQTKLLMSHIKETKPSTSLLKKQRETLVKQRELLMSPVKKREPSTSLVKQTELLMSPVKKTEQLTSAVKQTKLLMSHVKETEPSTSLVKQTDKQRELLMSPVKKRESSTSLVKQTKLLMSPVKQTELSKSFLKQTELSKSHVKVIDVIELSSESSDDGEKCQISLKCIRSVSPDLFDSEDEICNNDIYCNDICSERNIISDVINCHDDDERNSVNRDCQIDTKCVAETMQPSQNDNMCNTSQSDSKCHNDNLSENDSVCHNDNISENDSVCYNDNISENDSDCHNDNISENDSICDNEVLNVCHIEDGMETSFMISPIISKFKRKRKIPPVIDNGVCHFESYFDDEICLSQKCLENYKADVSKSKIDRVTDLSVSRNRKTHAQSERTLNKDDIDRVTNLSVSRNRTTHAQTERSLNKDDIDRVTDLSVSRNRTTHPQIERTLDKDDIDRVTHLSVSRNRTTHAQTERTLNKDDIDRVTDLSGSRDRLTDRQTEKTLDKDVIDIVTHVSRDKSLERQTEKIPDKDDFDRVTDLSVSRDKSTDRQTKKTLDKDDTVTVTDLSVPRDRSMDRQTKKTLDKDDTVPVTDLSVSRDRSTDRQTKKTLQKDVTVSDLSVSSDRSMDRQAEETLDKDVIDRVTDLSVSRDRLTHRQTKKTLDKDVIDRVTDLSVFIDRTTDSQTVTFLQNSVLNDVCESVSVEVTDDSIEVISVKDSESSLDVPETETQQNVKVGDDLDLTALIRSLEDGNRLNKPVKVTSDYATKLTDVNMTTKLDYDMQSSSQVSNLNVTEFVNDILRDDSNSSDDTILNLSQRIENFKVNYKQRLSYDNKEQSFDNEVSDGEMTSKKFSRHNSMESNFSQDSVYISDEELNYSSVYVTPKRQNNCQNDDQCQTDNYDDHCQDEYVREEIVDQNDEFDDMCQFDRLPKRQNNCQSDKDAIDDRGQTDNYDDRCLFDKHDESEREEIVDQNDDMCQFDRLVGPSVYITPKRQNYDDRAQTDNFDDHCHFECEREKIVEQNDEFDVMCQFDKLVHPRVRDLSTKKSIFGKAAGILNDKCQSLTSMSDCQVVTSTKIDDEMIAEVTKNNKCQSLTTSKASVSDCQVVTPTKMDDAMIVKVRDVTPMPEYDRMNSPEIVAELSKFGLKRLKRKKGVQLLKYLYESTHPVLEEDDNDTQTVKRRKIFVQETENCQNIENIHKDVNAGENVEDMIFERKTSKKIHSCQLPLHVAFHNLVASQQVIRESILLYEPLQVEVIYDMLKQHGHKYHIQDLVSFLDRKCITFRLAPRKTARI